MTLSDPEDDFTKTPQFPVGGSNNQPLPKKGTRRVEFEEPSISDYSGTVGLGQTDADSRSREITQIAEEVAAGTAQRVMDQLEAIVIRELDRRGVGHHEPPVINAGGQHQPPPAGIYGHRREEDFYNDDDEMDYAPPYAGRGRGAPAA